MPVRGTTEYRHAIIQKKIINHDRGGTHVMCAWSYCENDGYELYKIRVRDSAPNQPLKYLYYVFCSQTCKDHWLSELFKIKHAAES
jgi:hypothetical protein